MSKKYLISFFAILITFHSIAQTIDSLIRIGNELRNSGSHQQAINTYRKIFEYKKNSSLANYEIAYTYLIINDYKNSIKYSNRVIKAQSEKMIEGYIIKGSALDYMRKSKKSIRVYNHAIKLYPNSYLLQYNLGITCYNNNQLANAENNFLKSIEIDKFQPSSHFMLGLLMNEKKNRVQSMLSLYFFLMLEPNTERSVEAYKLLMSLWEKNIEVDSTKPNSLRIIYTPKLGGNDFNAIDLSISSIYASSIGKKQHGKYDYNLFMSNTLSLFNLIGDFKNVNEDVWHNLYIRFFSNLFINNQAELFCYYISTTCDDAIINSWLESNRDRIETFSLWVNENLMNK